MPKGIVENNKAMLRQKRRNDLNGALFRQGGATVSLKTRLSARGIREASYLKGGLWKK